MNKYQLEARFDDVVTRAIDEGLSYADIIDVLEDKLEDLREEAEENGE